MVLFGFDLVCICLLLETQRPLYIYIYTRQVESSEREVMESTSPFYVNSSSISGRQRKHRAFARMAVWCIILVTSGIILEDLNCCLLALLAHG